MCLWYKYSFSTLEINEFCFWCQRILDFHRTFQTTQKQKWVNLHTTINLYESLAMFGLGSLQFSPPPFYQHMHPAFVLLGQHRNTDMNDRHVLLAAAFMVLGSLWTACPEHRAGWKLHSLCSCNFWSGHHQWLKMLHLAQPQLASSADSACFLPSNRCFFCRMLRLPAVHLWIKQTF